MQQKTTTEIHLSILEVEKIIRDAVGAPEDADVRFYNYAEDDLGDWATLETVVLICKHESEEISIPSEKNTA